MTDVAFLIVICILGCTPLAMAILESLRTRRRKRQRDKEERAAQVTAAILWP